MLSGITSRLKRFFGDPGLPLAPARVVWSGYQKWNQFTQWPAHDRSAGSALQPNALRDFFLARKEGPGIWKWEHYFSIYDRHFSRFRGQDVHVLEIGIYSGGSLDMWKHYFGPRSHIYGVDIEPACKSYERESVKIFIGDQADRNFWRNFKREVGIVDIVIDDGGHSFEQQCTTVEELLPHLRPGGVYLCEDIHGTFNAFGSYLHGMAYNLNATEHSEENVANPERRLVAKATPLQSAIASLHLYPYAAVIERTDRPITEFVAEKHGSQWEPFLT